MARSIVAAAVGGLLGYCYFHYVGCPTGDCLIAGHLSISLALGAGSGALAANVCPAAGCA